MRSSDYIKEKGLRSYLDNTVELHNGCNYEEFVKRVDLGEPMSIIARAFKVDRRTIMKWVSIYEEELSNED